MIIHWQQGIDKMIPSRLEFEPQEVRMLTAILVAALRSTVGAKTLSVGEAADAAKDVIKALESKGML